MQTGRIIKALSGFYDVQTQDGTIARTRARGEFRKSKQKPLVGDFVEFDSDHDDGFIWKILPRENSLVRPPVANIDVAVIVSAAKEPDFSQNLLDRQLVALEAAGVTPVIYLSKLDLVPDAEWPYFVDLMQSYREIGYAVFGAQEAQQAQQDLQAFMQGKVVAFMGQTGAGKSTLLNALAPDLQLETGEVSKALSRGRHTTRTVALMPVGDSLIADTPGFSSYEVFDFTVEELDDYFPEFVAQRQACQFRGCLHLNEPNCAIKEAVAQGVIRESRYNSYKAFYTLIKNQKPRYARER
jgi:ribosome biogenesis GTPase